MGFLDFLSFSNKSYKNKYAGSGGVKASTKQLIQDDWKQIEILLNGGQPSQIRQALITADKALDNALRDVVPGDKMGDRLKNAKDKFEWATYDKIWKAHKLRNNLVHEAGFEPNHVMVKKAIEDLKNGLKALRVNV